MSEIMIRINLLDWRGEKREILNYRFYVITGVFVACCLILSLIVLLWIKHLTGNNVDALAYLAKETAAVDELLGKIKDLQQQKDSLIEKRGVIETLQASRSFVVIIFDNIARIMPEGVVITEFARNGNQLTLVGNSDSSAGVSTLMLNIQHLKWVTNAKIEEIKQDNSSSQYDKDGAQSGGSLTNKVRIGFKMNVTIDPSTVGE